MWDLIVSVPDHCLSFYLAKFHMEPLLVGGMRVVQGVWVKDQDGRHTLIW